MKIEAIIRHCNSKSVKNRPSFFSKEHCWDNFKRTVDVTKCNVTCLVDGDISNHFLSTEKDFPVIRNLIGGSDALSFLGAIDYVMNKNYSDDTIVYFLEDDYLHNYNWCNILIEGINLIPNGYVTLYDHLDKYSSMYDNLRSKVLVSTSCHWRETVSTTNSYAMLYKVFREDLNIHKQYCNLMTGGTEDHKKFLALGQIGKKLISSIPGYSTHCDQFMSPCISWSKL